MADLFQIFNSSDRFLGTGVLVAPNWILTCQHVVEAGRSFRLGREKGERARVLKVIRDQKLDLALLQVSFDFGEAGKWCHQVGDGQKISLVGYRENEAGKIKENSFAEPATPHLEDEWVADLEVKAGVLKGMSGGVGLVLVGRRLRIVGLIQDGGKDSYKSMLAGAGKVAPFLAKHGLKLAGCPDYEPLAQVDLDSEILKRYLKQLRKDTARIEIKHFRQSDGNLKHFAVEDLYVELKTEPGNTMDALVRQHRFVVLQGDAGSGKSTCLQALAHRWSEKGRYLPFRVKVAALDETIHPDPKPPNTPVEDTDPDWLAIHLAKANKSLSLPFCQRHLEKASTVLLLDGLDEALSDSRRGNLVKLLVRTAKHYKNCRFVLTTRPGALQGEALRELESAVSERIAPLEKEAIAKFIQNWSRCIYPGNRELADELEEDLARQVNAIAEVKAMASSPMTLTALAVIHKNGGTLPHGRAQLYASVLSWMAKQRGEGDHPGRWNEKETLEHLAAFAFGMQTHKKGRLKQVSVDQAPEILCSLSKLEPGEAVDFLLRQELDTGILVRRGETLEFRHLLFQEYLAANYLLFNRLEAPQRRILLEGRRRYSVEWREFLRLLMLQASKVKAQWIHSVILQGAGESIADRARTIALLRLCAADRKEREDQIDDKRYLKYVRSMEGLFRGEADGHNLDLRSRSQAAEAWELLVGDLTRLRLPVAREYWVSIKPNFAIGRHPVTVYEYAAYLEACPSVKRPHRWEEQRRFLLRPVVYVSFHDAEDYCKWASQASQQAGVVIRLPSEEEWYEAAAGGQQPQREYPWGEVEPTYDHANYDYEARQLTPVGLFPKGATPDGQIFDLAGNVWEWTASPYVGDEKSRVLRGGSYVNVAWDLRSACRSYNGAGVRSSFVGFRCVREVSP